MKAAPGCVDLPAAPLVFVKRGRGGSGNGRNWPLPYFLAIMSGIIGIFRKRV